MKKEGYSANMRDYILKMCFPINQPIFFQSFFPQKKREYIHTHPHDAPSSLSHISTAGDHIWHSFPNPKSQIPRQNKQKKKYRTEHFLSTVSSKHFLFYVREKRWESIRQGGLESMQYSRSWSCSIGGWLISAAIVGNASTPSFRNRIKK